MKVYGISDLHLSFQLDKPMYIFGTIWKNYENKIAENWKKKVKEEDIVIIAGDISWATYLKEAVEDFRFIDNLPGKKIILKGNHDYYFDTKTKLERFFESNNFNTISVLHNNAIDLNEEYILCGTRGYGKDELMKDADKISKREQTRLKLSLDLGKKIQNEYLEKGINKKILVAMHYPPFEYEYDKILEEYKVYKCIYGHLHGFGHSKIKEGNINNVNYVMVSVDYTNFDVIEL